MLKCPDYRIREYFSKRQDSEFSGPSCCSSDNHPLYEYEMVSMATLIFVELLKIMFFLINHYTCNADTPYLGQNLSVIRALTYYVIVILDQGLQTECQTSRIDPK